MFVKEVGTISERAAAIGSANVRHVATPNCMYRKALGAFAENDFSGDWHTMNVETKVGGAPRRFKPSSGSSAAVIAWRKTPSFDDMKDTRPSSSPKTYTNNFHNFEAEPVCLAPGSHEPGIHAIEGRKLSKHTRHKGRDTRER